MRLLQQVTSLVSRSLFNVFVKAQSVIKIYTKHISTANKSNIRQSTHKISRLRSGLLNTNSLNFV